MRHALLVLLFVIGVGCAAAPTAAPKDDCCGKPATPKESFSERDTRRQKLVGEGKAYYDETGKFHDHATTAMVWTVCNCKVCDRADKCCGPNHCVCNPN